MRAEVIEDIQTLGELALPHLWKDEINDVFILTKRMEIYVYSKTVLGCYCFHKKTYLQLRKKGLIFHIHETDDPLVFFLTDLANLTLLLALGTFKRRPHKNGRWIKSKEILLGHRILPCKVSHQYPNTNTK
ncbi:MAG: hypothetical protein HOC71_17840 [Candidatus Latescibacteria bacterium]|jgi:hypothetical protein|nr:hypothetical protein [Candidatus Latescibacterota bacterium]